MVSWSKLAPGSATRIPPGCGVGIVTGAASGIVVIDTDVKKVDGEANLRALGELPETYMVRTGSGGFHRYYLHPGRPVKTSGNALAPGVDVRGDGGIVVAPGSAHVQGRYDELNRLPMVPLPAWFLEHPESRPTVKDLGQSAIARGGEYPDYEPRITAGAIAARDMPASVEGAGGSVALFNLCQYLVRACELPLDVAEDLIEQHFNPRCDPEWNENEIRHKLHDARDVAMLPIGGVDMATLIEGTKATVQPLIDDALFNRLEARAKDAVPPQVMRTELGNAHLYHFYNAGKVLYVQSMGWMQWDGSRWAPDPEGLGALRATQAVTDHLLMASAGGGADEQKASFKWALDSQSKKIRTASLGLAKALYPLVKTEHLDADPWMLNCPNGTLNLRTGDVVAPSPDSLITKVAGVAYDPDARCPTWERFLSRIFEGDTELIAYIQRFMGYCLTGSVQEQMMVYFYGQGANGKSTMTVVLQKLLGEYAVTSPSSMLLARMNDQHPTAFADLRGARLTVCQEIEQGRAWDEALLKQLTGDDIIRARRMHRDFFEFHPSHKIAMSANHRPTVKGVDHGIWRRIRLVPFLATIGESERDQALKEKLELELPGILNWVLAGCIAWQRQGLGTCQAVEKGTAEYREEEDVIGQFLGASMHVHVEGEITKKELYFAYANWSGQEGEKEPMSPKVFVSKMRAKGFTEKMVRGERMWKGVMQKGAGSKSSRPS